MSNYIFPDGIYGEAAQAAYEEIIRAKQKHGDKLFNSMHEGFAVLKEEVDELWADVMNDRKQFAVYEAVQVAAMALRIVAEFGTYPFAKPIPTVGSPGDLMSLLVDIKNENHKLKEELFNMKAQLKAQFATK